MATLEQRTPAWHAARVGKLTASNLGAILGQVSYVPRTQAYKRIMGTEPFSGNIATMWGVQNEVNGINAYQTFTGNIVESTGLHTHKEYDWFAGSPDGFVGSEGMIEVKCPFYFRKDGSGRLHSSVPGHYLLQMNALLEICERQWCDYVCWSPEGMVVFRVQRDPELFETVLPYYMQVNEAMKAKAVTPPPLPSSEKEKITLALLQSGAKCVDYKFWQNADPHDPIPLEDIDISPPHKRPKF